MFPGSTLSDHCLRYENIPQIKLIVVLGELGGQDEYSLVSPAPICEKQSSCRVPLHLQAETLSESLSHLVLCQVQHDMLPWPLTLRSRKSSVPLWADVSSISSLLLGSRRQHLHAITEGTPEALRCAAAAGDRAEGGQDPEAGGGLGQRHLRQAVQERGAVRARRRQVWRPSGVCPGDLPHHARDSLQLACSEKSQDGSMPVLWALHAAADCVGCAEAAK